MRDQLTKDYYQDAENARRFEQSRFYGPFGDWLNGRDVAFFTRHPRIAYDTLGQVLELGCGTGRITRPLLQHTAARVVAVDRSPQMLAELARCLGEPLPGHLSLQTGSVESLDFADDSFDLVLFARLLMHVADWQALLARVCRLSRQWLMFDMPVRGSLASVGKGVVDFVQHRQGEGCYRFFYLPRVVELLHQHGFEVVDQQRLLLLPIPLHMQLGHPELTLGLERWLGGAWLRQRVGSPVYLVARRIS